MSGQRRRVCQGPPVFCPSSGWMLWVTPWRHEWHAHQMFRGHRTRRENQEAPPRVWIQRDLEGLEEWLQIEETQRRVKSKTLHYIQVGGPDSRRPPTVGLVWADEQCDVSPSTVLPNPVKTPYHLRLIDVRLRGPSLGFLIQLLYTGAGEAMFWWDPRWRWESTALEETPCSDLGTWLSSPEVWKPFCISFFQLGQKPEGRKEFWQPGTVGGHGGQKSIWRREKLQGCS